jgi:hypothetical protein
VRTAAGFASCWLGRVAAGCAKPSAAPAKHNTTPNHNARAVTKTLLINFFARTAALALRPPTKFTASKLLFQLRREALKCNFKFELRTVKAEISNPKFQISTLPPRPSSLAAVFLVE